MDSYKEKKTLETLGERLIRMRKGQQEMMKVAGTKANLNNFSSLKIPAIKESANERLMVIRNLSRFNTGSRLHNFTYNQLEGIQEHSGKETLSEMDEDILKKYAPPIAAPMNENDENPDSAYFENQILPQTRDQRLKYALINMNSKVKERLIDIVGKQEPVLTNYLQKITALDQESVEMFLDYGIKSKRQLDLFLVRPDVIDLQKRKEQQHFLTMEGETKAPGIDNDEIPLDENYMDMEGKKKPNNKKNGKNGFDGNDGDGGGDDGDDGNDGDNGGPSFNNPDNKPSYFKKEDNTDRFDRDITDDKKNILPILKNPWDKQPNIKTEMEKNGNEKIKTTKDPLVSDNNKTIVNNDSEPPNGGPGKTMFDSYDGIPQLEEYGNNDDSYLKHVDAMPDNNDPQPSPQTSMGQDDGIVPSSSEDIDFSEFEEDPNQIKEKDSNLILPDVPQHPILPNVPQGPPQFQPHTLDRYRINPLPSKVDYPILPPQSPVIIPPQVNYPVLPPYNPQYKPYKPINEDQSVILQKPIKIPDSSYSEELKREIEELIRIRQLEEEQKKEKIRLEKNEKFNKIDREREKKEKEELERRLLNKEKKESQSNVILPSLPSTTEESKIRQRFPNEKIKPVGNTPESKEESKENDMDLWNYVPSLDSIGSAIGSIGSAAGSIGSTIGSAANQLIDSIAEKNKKNKKKDPIANQNTIEELPINPPKPPNPPKNEEIKKKVFGYSGKKIASSFNNLKVAYNNNRKKLDTRIEKLILLLFKHVDEQKNGIANAIAGDESITSIANFRNAMNPESQGLQDMMNILYDHLINGTDVIDKQSLHGLGLSSQLITTQQQKSPLKSATINATYSPFGQYFLSRTELKRGLFKLCDASNKIIENQSISTPAVKALLLFCKNGKTIPKKKLDSLPEGAMIKEWIMKSRGKSPISNFSEKIVGQKRKIAEGMIQEGNNSKVLKSTL